MGTISVITSGKGGVGKSTVSAELGRALARHGQRVLLLDGDAGLRSLDLILGVGDRAVYDLSDIFEGRCAPVKAIYPVGDTDGLFVIPAPTALEHLCSPADMRRLCRGLTRFYDQVLIDCPAGIGEGFEVAAVAAQRALLITTPDMVCARDAQIVSQLLADKKLASRLVINRLRPAAIRAGKMPDIDEIIDTVGVQLIGVIPEDEAVTVAAGNGALTLGACHAAACIDNIARRFLGETVPLANLYKM